MRQDNVAATANSATKMAGHSQSVPRAMPITIATGRWTQSSAINARLVVSRSALRSLLSTVMLKFLLAYFAAIANGSMGSQAPCSRRRINPSRRSGCTTSTEGIAVVLTMAALAEAAAAKIRCALHHGGKATATTSAPGWTCNDSAATAIKLAINKPVALPHAGQRDVVMCCARSIRQKTTKTKLIRGKYGYPAQASAPESSLEMPSPPSPQARLLPPPGFKRAGGKGNRSLCCPLRLHDPRGDLAAQPFEAEQRVGAGLRDLDALGGKVLAEEFEMRRAFVELLWRQHRRKDWDFGAQLHVHQRPDHGIRDVFVIDHEPRRDDRSVAPRLGEQLHMQRDFERARHLEHVDACAFDVARLDLIQECEAALFDHLAMPGRLHEGDPLRFCKSRMLRDRRRLGGLAYFRGVFCLRSIFHHLIHGFPPSGPESAHTERRPARIAAVATVLFQPDFNRRLRNHTESADPFSRRRLQAEGTRRSRAWVLFNPYRRWGLSPRPENIGRPV